MSIAHEVFLLSKRKYKYIKQPIKDTKNIIENTATLCPVEYISLINYFNIIKNFLVIYYFFPLNK